MTSKLTREQLHERARENVKALKMASRQHAFESAREEILADLQLAELALAAMDCEPVAWMAIYHGEIYDDAIGITRSVVEAQADRFGWESALTEIIPLYRHAQPAPEKYNIGDATMRHIFTPTGMTNVSDMQAVFDRVEAVFVGMEQPAPVVSFYRDGIEAAAKWIDQQREAYDSEHGWSDPDTGAFEFGNNAQREYSSTLEELAEGIRALHPNAGNSPVIGIDLTSGPDRSVEVRYVAPPGYVMVPKKPTAEMIWAAKYCFTSTPGWDVFKSAYIAMLAAAPQEVK